MKICLNTPLSIVAALLLQLHVVAQTEYQEFISAPGGDTISQVYFVNTPDGGGFFWLRDDTGDRKMIRVDAAGAPQWAKRVAYATNPGSPIHGTAVATLDNGLIIWAHGSSSQGNVHHTAVKLSAAGQEEWARHFTAPAQDASYLFNIVEVVPDGSTVMVSVWFDFIATMDLAVIKVASDGTPLWSFTRSSNAAGVGGSPTPRTALLPDGSLIIAYDTEAGNESMEIIKLDANGQMLWLKRHEMENAFWDVEVSGVAAHSTGNFVVSGERSSGLLMYKFHMWFTPDGELYRHQLNDDNDYGAALNWYDEGIWQWKFGGWTLLDSTGSATLGGFRLETPGVQGSYMHTLSSTAPCIEPDSVWMAGIYRKVETQLGYVEERPFLLRSAIDPVSGCRLLPIAPAAVTYIDVPDSLMIITTEGPALPDVVTYVDTAVVLVDLPLPTTYDFCSIVSVDETQPTPDAVQLWPDPVAQGVALNIQSTVAADLTIFDTRGRLALRNNELLATRVVNTAPLARGTYMAVGCDKKGVRLWSRPFVVL